MGPVRAAISGCSAASQIEEDGILGLGLQPVARRINTLAYRITMAILKKSRHTREVELLHLYLTRQKSVAACGFEAMLTVRGRSVQCIPRAFPGGGAGAAHWDGDSRSRASCLRRGECSPRSGFYEYMSGE